MVVEGQVRELRTVLRTYYAASKRINDLLKELDAVTNSLKEYRNIVQSQKEQINQHLEGLGIVPSSDEDWAVKYLNLLAMLSSLSD